MELTMVRVRLLTSAATGCHSFMRGVKYTSQGRQSCYRLTRVKASRPRMGDETGMNEMPLIDSGEEKILSLPDETQFTTNGIVSRTLLRTPTTRVVLFGFAEGQELTEHTSTSQALIQVLSGRCEFTLDGKPHTLKAGDLLHMPPNLPHAVKATEKFSMLLTLLKPGEATPILSRVKAGALAVK